MQEMFTLGHVNLWTCIFTCTLEGYRKDTGRVTEFCQGGNGIALQLYPHTGSIPEGYRKDTGREPKIIAPWEGLKIVTHVHTFTYT